MFYRSYSLAGSAASREISYYQAVMRPFGLPMDGRVLGGVFLPMLYDSAVRQKWRQRPH